MTIDGYIAGLNGEMDFMVWDWDDKLNQYVTELTEPVDCIVLGRKLAQGFIPHWAAVAANPDNPVFTAGKKFTDTHKVVFTKTLEEVSLGQYRFSKRRFLLKRSRILKKRYGKDIIAYGGANFVAGLIKHSLIDELHLFINPAAIGNGMSIFKVAFDGKLDFSLVKATSFACGIVVLQYEPKRQS